MSTGFLRSNPPKIIEIKSNFSSTRSLSPLQKASGEKQSPLSLKQSQLVTFHYKPCQSIEIDSKNQVKEQEHLPLLFHSRSNFNEKQTYFKKQLTQSIKSDSNLNDNSKNSPQNNIDSNTSTLQKVNNLRKVMVVSKFQENAKSIYPQKSTGLNHQMKMESNLDQNQNPSIDEIQYPIDNQLEKYIVIFHKLQNLSLEKRNNYNFLNLIIKILNLLIQLDSKKLKNDYNKIKQDLLNQIKSFLICENDQLYSQIDHSPRELKQLSFMQVANRLNQKLQEIQNKNFSKQKQSDDEFLQNSLPSQIDIEKLKQTIENSLESEEIIKLKRVIQTLSIQKNDLNKILSEQQIKIKHQQEIIDELKHQIHKTEKKNNEKQIQERIELKQNIYNLELKVEEIQKQNEEMLSQKQLISTFAHDLLKIITQLNHTIQTYEMDYVYKKQIETLANREKFDLIYQTKQQTPQIKQSIRKLLDLQIAQH